MENIKHIVAPEVSLDPSIDDRFWKFTEFNLSREMREKRVIRSSDRIFPIMQMRKTEYYYNEMMNAIGESCGWKDLPFIDECWNHWLTYSAGMVDAAIDKKFFPGRMADINQSSSMKQLLSLYALKRNGSYIYDISRDLAIAFSETECNLPGEILKVPTGSFYVSVPRGIGFNLVAADGEYELDGMHVTSVDWGSRDGFSRSTHADGNISFPCTVKRFGREDMGLTWSIRESQVKSLLCVAVFLKKPGECMWDNFIVDFPVPLSCKNIGKEMAMVPNASVMIDILDGPVDSIHRIAVNAAMYICSDMSDVKKEKFGPSKKDIEKAKNGDKSASKRVKDSTVKVSYYKVGENVKLCENMGKHLSQDKEGRKLTSGHMVRGHWRTILHGKGKTEATPRYIQPHWRGPSFDDVLARIVKVR